VPAASVRWRGVAFAAAVWRAHVLVRGQRHGMRADLCLAGKPDSTAIFPIDLTRLMTCSS
jgi:hypothetical protein